MGEGMAGVVPGTHATPEQVRLVTGLMDAVGRSIVQDPAREWLTSGIGDNDRVERCGRAFEELITAWRRIRSA